MKKRDFVTLLVGAVAGLIFALGICMCLLPEWNAFTAGVVLTAVGGVALVVLGIVRWVMSGAKLHINWTLTGRIAFGVVGSLTLGVGMCLIMVWNHLFGGIVVGVVGMILLICLIPMCLGFKSDEADEADKMD